MDVLKMLHSWVIMQSKKAYVKLTSKEKIFLLRTGKTSVMSVKLLFIISLSSQTDIWCTILVVSACFKCPYLSERDNWGLCRSLLGL